MTLKLNFNTPCPKNERSKVIKAFKDLGFTYERIIQSGDYSLHRFYGRLPTIHCTDVKIESISCDDDFKKEFKNVDAIEIYLFIER